MDIAITKMSSKGQIVIPVDLRKDFEIGEKLVVIKQKSQLIIKKVSEMDKNFEEDLKFARRTEAALERMKNGEGITMDFDDFIEEMKKW